VVWKEFYSSKKLRNKICMRSHPNNIVNGMRQVGYKLTDMLPAYPGKDIEYLDSVLRDSAMTLNRPFRHYGLLGTYPCTTRHFNFTEHGFRSNGSEQPWPPSRETINIFFFGGSTTLGYNIEDSQTIPACLQKYLKENGCNVEIYNFGGGNYNSRHEFLSLLSLIDNGIYPDYAIFLDGYNECSVSSGSDKLILLLNNLYQQEKKRRKGSYLGSLYDYMLSSFKSRKSPLPNSRDLKSVGNGDLFSQDGVKRVLDVSGKVDHSEVMDEACVRFAMEAWDMYLNTVTLVEAICKMKQIIPLFVWQPIPFFRTKNNQRVMERLFFVYPHAVMGYYAYTWLHKTGFTGMINKSNFYNLSELGTDIEGKLYVDVSHYSAMFSSLIANKISSILQQVVLKKQYIGKV